MKRPSIKQIRLPILLLLVCWVFVPATPALSQDVKAEAKAAEAKTEEAKEAEKKEVLAGHSMHGEAFDEGPRQKAYLMGHTGNVNFPITTKNEEVQKFFNQGVGQLHGFWYLEAERSFRQVAAIEPDCAMAYWGMAMANTNNSKRAKAFIERAVSRKANISRREQMWIDALAARYKDEKKDEKLMTRQFVRDMENIVYEFPEDIEAKAFLALYLWKDSRTLPISSHGAIDSMLELVFRENPMHPAHHYRIHLWDAEKAERALRSAARNGQAAPDIAHMWHMSGHIFSKLKRYEDAVYQQEASARVDHAHMIRDHVMPYEIHNYAHNNEWCIRNLIFIGRARDGLSLAKNMIELPRHPKFNITSNRGSGAAYGRARLFDVLLTYEMWDEYLALADTVYLDVSDSADDQVKKLRYQAVASAALGQTEKADALLKDLEARLAKLNTEQAEAVKKAVDKVHAEASKSAPPKTEKKEAPAKDEKAKDEKADEAKPEEKKPEEKKPEEKKPDDPKLAEKLKKAEGDAKRGFEGKMKELERSIEHVRAQQLAHAGEHVKALEIYKKLSDLKREHLALAHMAAEDQTKAEQLIQQAVTTGKEQVYPLAVQVKILSHFGKQKEAKDAFEVLRKTSYSMDLDLPIFQQITAWAVEQGYPADWRLPAVTKDDVGDRPDLATLGPFRWHPAAAADFNLADSAGKPFSLHDYRGKPVLIIFYLGYGCLHCAEQLNAFAPMIKEYENAGITVLAISSDSPGDLKKSLDNCKTEGGFPFPLVSDESLKVFKDYRAFDDFEQVPLHGTFLIDGKGQIRWQDIGAEPFSNPKFLLTEAQRLLAQP